MLPLRDQVAQGLVERDVVLLATLQAIGPQLRQQPAQLRKNGTAVLDHRPRAALELRLACGLFQQIGRINLDRGQQLAEFVM